MSNFNVASVKELLGVCTCTDGNTYKTLSYYPPVYANNYLYGGREYAWDSTIEKNRHDGGTFISNTVPWDGTNATLEDFLNGVGETDASGTGCFVLTNPMEVFVEDYGAVGDGSTDDWAPIDKSLNRKLRYVHGSENHAGVVRLNDREYFLSQTLNMKSVVDFRGAYGNMGGRETCVLQFSADTNGIIVNRDDTYGDGTVSPVSGDARSSKVSGMIILGDGTDTSAHGLWMRKGIVVEDVQVNEFPGNGVHIEATARSTDPSRVGNANGWQLNRVSTNSNGGHGVYVDGADVNAGIGYSIDTTRNGGWGIYDSSFLGNTWVGCHAASNYGAYKTDNANARSLFIGCYSEGGQQESELKDSSLAIGGLHGAGINGTYLDGDDLTIRDVIAKRQIRVEERSTDYTPYFFAHNENGRGTNGLDPHGRYETGFMGYGAWKADGTPRPCGGMYTSPQGTDRNEQTVVGWYIYDGETTDEMVKVAHFWGNSDFTPTNDNTTQMGWSGDAWRTLYLNHAPLVPSDASEVQSVEALSQAEINVATALKGLVRKFNRAGSSLKHVGLVADDVVAAFQAENLNALDYGVVEGGERLHVRNEELLAFIIAAI